MEGPGETAVAPRMTVSGGGDGMVKVWDLQLGREVVSMAGHSAEVVSRNIPIWSPPPLHFICVSSCSVVSMIF